MFNQESVDQNQAINLFQTTERASASEPRPEKVKYDPASDDLDEILGDGDFLQGCEVSFLLEKGMYLGRIVSIQPGELLTTPAGRKIVRDWTVVAEIIADKAGKKIGRKIIQPIYLVDKETFAVSEDRRTELTFYLAEALAATNKDATTLEERVTLAKQYKIELSKGTMKISKALLEQIKNAYLGVYVRQTDEQTKLLPSGESITFQAKNQLSAQSLQQVHDRALEVMNLKRHADSADEDSLTQVPM